MFNFRRFILKKVIIAASVLLASFAASADFTSVSYNRVDWTSSSPQKDYNFIEVEKGVNRDWGSFYGFVDVERFDHYNSEEDVKISAKGVITLKSGGLLDHYGQVFTYAEKNFQVTDTVVGETFTLGGDGWWFNSFAGLQHSVINNNFTGQNFAGINGVMVGWNAGYFITEKVQITNWNEFTFARDNRYLAISGDSRDIGINGALAVWYHFTPNFSTGLQWRYADNKLGSTHGSNAIVYTAKVTF